MTEQAIRNVTLEQIDADTTIHPYTELGTHAEKGPMIIESGKGIYITDNKGNSYIDAMASLFCVNIGYGRSEVADAIARQAHKLAYHHNFASNSNEQEIKLADRLVNKLLPKNINKIMFASSGSEANDANLKFIWMYNYLRGKPNKTKIISRDMGYHGVTVAATSMCGIPLMHTGFNLPLPGFLHTEKPHYYWNGQPGESERDYAKRCAKMLEDLILQEGPDTVAAFVAEPVMGAGACITPPEGYFEEMQKVMKKYDVLFIADEVITGFGRLGEWFAADFYGFEPDLMTISKGITSAYQPLSAACVSEEIWEVLRDGIPSDDIPMFMTGATASGHPVACAAANANLDIFENEDLVGNAKRVGKYFKDQIHERFEAHPLMGDIRGEGLMLAIELVADKETKEVLNLEWDCSHRLFDLCLEEKLITRGFFGQNATSFSPPLCITKEEVDEVLDRFGRALDKLTNELISDGRWKPKN
ncbi:MAG: aminotransferase [Alphaproteobacteria bacterium]